MRSLTFKLSMAFLLVSLAGVALVALLVWVITSREFDRFLLDRAQSDFVTATSAYYEANGSWVGVVKALQQQGFFPKPSSPGNSGPTSAQPQPFALVDQNGVVIAGGGPFHTGDQVPPDLLSQGVPVTVNGQRVGTVIASGLPPGLDPAGHRYLTRINQALLIAALGATVLALVLGILLARTVTRPVRELTAAARAMAEGRLEQQVSVRSQDELGTLTGAFNQMSADLARANQLRRQMTADIAHDLRTPLTVIGGYAESLRDGVLKPTPERFEAIHAEVLHLERLVEDLRLLTQADAGELSINRVQVAPSVLLEQAARSYRPLADKQGISLRLQAEAELPEIRVDPDRMAQVLGNLISNSLRFTPQGGVISLSARREGASLLLEVEDNGAGIPPEALPHVFERFYRADAARQDGSSGLGLAIATAIVELHGGRITASSPGSGRGSRFSISLRV